MTASALSVPKHGFFDPQQPCISSRFWILNVIHLLIDLMHCLNCLWLPSFSYAYRLESFAASAQSNHWCGSCRRSRSFSMRRSPYPSPLHRGLLYFLCSSHWIYRMAYCSGFHLSDFSRGRRSSSLYLWRSFFWGLGQSARLLRWPLTWASTVAAGISSDDSGWRPALSQRPPVVFNWHSSDCSLIGAVVLNYSPFWSTDWSICAMNHSRASGPSCLKAQYEEPGAGCRRLSQAWPHFAWFCYNDHLYLIRHPSPTICSRHYIND